MARPKRIETAEQRRQRMTENTRRYRVKWPERVKETRHRQYASRKKRAMEMLGGAVCSHCGCTELSFLEFNHINGGGSAEWRGSYHGMTDRLLSRKRETSDLNVLCRVCNAFDHLRRRDPEAAKMYDIRYAKFINQEDQWQEITKVVEN
jgi:hypothetical protein